MRYPTIVAVALVAAAGCDLFNNTLEVQNPSNVPAGGLETPANAQLLVNSAIADFECAAGAYAVMGGEITDELIDATQTADRYPYERRSMVSSDARYAVNGCVGLGVYTPLQTARFSAVNGPARPRQDGRAAGHLRLRKVCDGVDHQHTPQQPRLAGEQRHQRRHDAGYGLHQHERPARAVLRQRTKQRDGLPPVPAAQIHAVVQPDPTRVL